MENNYYMKGNDDDSYSKTKVEFEEWLKTNHFNSDSSVESSIRKLDFISNMFTRNLSGHRSVFEIDNCEALESFIKVLLNHDIFLNLNQHEKEAYEACLKFFKEFLSVRSKTYVDLSDQQNIDVEKTSPNNGLKNKIDTFDLCLRTKKTNEEKFIEWLYFNKSISAEKAEHVLKRINQIEFVFSENLDSFNSVTEIKSLCDYQSVKVNLLEDPHFRELDRKNLNAYKNSLSLFEEYLTKPKINYRSGKINQTDADKESINKDRYVSVIKAEKKAEALFKYTEKQKLAFDNQKISKNSQASEEKKAEPILIAIESLPNDTMNYKSDVKALDTVISELFKCVKYRQFLESLQNNGILTIDELLNIDIFKYLNNNDLYSNTKRIDMFVDIKKVLKKYQQEITTEVKSISVMSPKETAHHLDFIDQESKKEIEIANTESTSLLDSGTQLTDVMNNQTEAISATCKNLSEIFCDFKYKQFLEALLNDSILTIADLSKIDIFKYMNEHEIYFYKKRLEILEEVKEILKDYQAPQVNEEITMSQISALEKSQKIETNDDAVSDLKEQLVSLNDENSYIGKKPHYFTLNGTRYYVIKWDDVLCMLSEQLFIMKPEEMAKWIDKPCFENSEVVIFSKKPINYEKERKLTNGIFITKFSRINSIIKTCYSLCNKCGIQPQAFSIFSLPLKKMQPFKSEVTQTSLTKQSDMTIPPKEIVSEMNREVRSSVNAQNQTVYTLSDLPEDMSQLRPCLLKYANATIKIVTWNDCYQHLCQLLAKMKIKSFKMARFKNQAIVNQKKCLSYLESSLIKPKNIGMNIWIETDYTEPEAVLACQLLCKICEINKNDVLIICINNDKKENIRIEHSIGAGFPSKEISVSVNNEPEAASNRVEELPEATLDDIQPAHAVELKNENQTVEFDVLMLGTTGKEEPQKIDQVSSHEIIVLLSNIDEKNLNNVPSELVIEKQILAVKDWVDLYLNLIKHLTTSHIEILNLLRYKNILLPNHKKIISYTSIHLKDPQYIGKNMFVELALDKLDAFMACQVLCEKCKIDMTKIAIKFTEKMVGDHRDSEENDNLINDYNDGVKNRDKPDVKRAINTTPYNQRQNLHQQYRQKKADEINTFLLSSGFQAIHFKELREKFDLYNDDLIQIINYNTQFVEILDRQYIHRDNIIDLDMAVDDMETILTTHFNQFLGYSNNQLLYKALRISNMLFLNDNDLDDMEKVYYLAKHVFEREKKLGEPCVFYGNKHIWQKTPDFPKSTFGLLINYARSKDNLITREECDTYLEKICITNTSIKQILKIGSLDTFLQYDTDQYLLKESLKIEGVWLHQLNECLAALFAETKLAIIRDINKEWYQELPQLPYGLQWTPLFLQEVLYHEKDIEYRTIPAIKGQRYDTLQSAIVPEHSDIITFGDVVYTLLFSEKMVDKRYEGEELRQILKNYGLLENNELYANMPQALVDYRFAWDSDKKTVFINGGA